MGPTLMILIFSMHRRDRLENYIWKEVKEHKLLN
jgi:hypothetical protein